MKSTDRVDFRSLGKFNQLGAETTRRDRKNRLTAAAPALTGAFNFFFKLDGVVAPHQPKGPRGSYANVKAVVAVQLIVTEQPNHAPRFTPQPRHSSKVERA